MQVCVLTCLCMNLKTITYSLQQCFLPVDRAYALLQCSLVHTHTHTHAHTHTHTHTCTHVHTLTNNIQFCRSRSQRKSQVAHLVTAHHVISHHNLFQLANHNGSDFDISTMFWNRNGKKVSRRNRNFRVGKFRLNASLIHCIH